MAVVLLADQGDLISWRRVDGSVDPENLRTKIVLSGGTGIHQDFYVLSTGRPPPPAPNIAAAHGLFPAHAMPEVIAVFEVLGLMAGGRWTEAAETVVWRVQPREWALPVTSDPRFVAAVERAFTTMPESIREAFATLHTIREEDVAAEVRASLLRRQQFREERGLALGGAPFSPEQARRWIEFNRLNSLEALICRHWRLHDGWLSTEASARAIDVFSDPLARDMRDALLARFHPDRPPPRW